MKCAIQAKHTALVLIDLQHGILNNADLQPKSGQQLLSDSQRFINRAREAGVTIVRVRVSFSEEDSKTLFSFVDQPSMEPGTSTMSEWGQFPDRLDLEDIEIVKHQWGAFTGTNLDQLLRRRKITTILLTGCVYQYGG